MAPVAAAHGKDMAPSKYSSLQRLKHWRFISQHVCSQRIKLMLMCRVCCWTHLPDIGCEGRGDLMACAVRVDIVLNAIFLRSPVASAQHGPLHQIRSGPLTGS